MVARLKTETKVSFREYGELTLPAGLLCSKITEGGTAGCYFLRSLPKEIFPPDSLIWFDAYHYGVVIPPEFVEDSP